MSKILYFTFCSIFVGILGAQVFDDLSAPTQALGQECKKDSHCITRNARCRGGDGNSRCSCVTGFEQNGTECFAKIGAYCDDDSDCSTLENSKCSEAHECVCEYDYSPYNKKQCLPPVGPNQPCKLSEQCKKYMVKNYICRSSEFNYLETTCQCNIGYHISGYNATCIQSKGWHAECQNDEECYVDKLNITLRCRDGRCDCPEGYINEDDRTCRAGASRAVQTVIFTLIVMVVTILIK